MFLVVGSGKTGSEVVKLIPQDQLLAVCNTKKPSTVELMKKAACIIVFVPADAFAEIQPILIESGVPVVIGTTGLSLPHTLPLKAPWIIGSNFSIGMNLMFKFAREIPKNIVNHVSIYEEHHIHKKDSPSGTALYLKSLFPTFNVDVEAKREADVKGLHSLALQLDGEILKIEHTALDRSVFAKGALFAASKIKECKIGLHRFEEMF